MNRSMHTLAVVLSCVAAVAFNPTAKADTTTFDITDLLTGADFYAPNTTTFAGTGYVGMLTPGYGTEFYEKFGLEALFSNNENIAISNTELQVDIGSLAGDTINSAVLSYDLINNPGAQIVTVTSYNSNGTLSYNDAPPSSLGSTTFISQLTTANSVDVTGLLQSSVSSNAAWFGLFLAPTDTDQGSDSGASTGTSPDEAEVRLTVDYSGQNASGTPEPGAWALLVATGVMGVGFARKRRRRRA